MRHQPLVAQFIQFLYVENANLAVGDNDWRSLIEVLEAEDLIPQVYSMLANAGKLGAVPSSVEILLRKGRDRALYQNMLVKKQAERILKEFDNKKIQTILLKGVRFSERYFGNLGARMTSDIDILVPNDFTSSASKILCEQLGYHLIPSYRPHHFHDQFCRGKSTNELDPVVVELHHHIVEDRIAHVELQTWFKSADLLDGYENILELSEQQTFYFACIHAANHSMEHLKHHIDIIHLLCRSGSTVDLNALVRQALQDKTTNMVGVVLSSIYEEFPFLEQFQPLPRGLKRFWTQKRVHYDRLLQFATLSDWRRRIQLAKHLLLPSRYDAIRWAGLSYDTKLSIFRIYASLYLARIRRLVFRRVE